MRYTFGMGVTRTDATKSCNSCGLMKPLGDFYGRKASPDGLAYSCKDCTCRSVRRWRLANQEKVRASDRARRSKAPRVSRYGLTAEGYSALLAEQRNGCAICGRVEGWSGRRLSIDHDHLTGQVRGLLCSGCNAGIGHFMDNQDLLASAIAYLQRWSERDAAEDAPLAA